MTAEQWLSDLEAKADTATYFVSMPPSDVTRLIAMVRALALTAGDKVCAFPKQECPEGTPCDQCAITYVYNQAEPKL